MHRFRRVLQRAERRLEAPEPERSRILVEMAGDLEDLYRTYRDRGLDEAEARRRAERWLAPSPAALASLREVHLPAFARLLDRLGGTTRGRIELALVALVASAAVAAGVFAALRSGAVVAASPGLWIVAALAAAGLATGCRQAYALFVRGDRLREGWRRRPGRVLAAATATALAGLLAGGLRLSLTGAPAQLESAPAAAWSEIAVAAGLAGLALSASLLLALLWLLLRVRVERVSRARTRLRKTMESLDLEETGL